MWNAVFSAVERQLSRLHELAAAVLLGGLECTFGILEEREKKMNTDSHSRRARFESGGEGRGAVTHTLFELAEWKIQECLQLARHLCAKAS